MSAQESTGDRRGGRRWPLFGGLALAVVLAAGIAFVVLGGWGSAGQEGEVAGTGGNSEDDASGAEGSAAELGPPTLGREDAPVTMVEYSDFQCPYCGQFAREVEPELVDEYVEDGTLRIEWRDFPYLGQESVNAALAARAAQERGKFWEYHEALYESQESVNSGTFSDEDLMRIATEVGLDAEEVESSLTSSEYEQAVRSDFEEGQQRGVTGTPTFVINGETIVGAQPKEEFERVIEEAAAQAERDSSSDGGDD